MKKSVYWVHSIQESYLNEAKKLISDYLDSLKDFDVKTSANGKHFVSLNGWGHYGEFCSMYRNGLFPAEKFEAWLKAFGWVYRSAAADLLAVDPSSSDEEDDIK